ncbi:glycosyltransferase [Alkalibacterium pelagium]|uniref:Poly-beta-1,6 N-acetyl-D-glucosamine synthase n=1 Tax=Alkalibacterium pelagium TaxID=426702 RepID=A0A1H7KIF2_9LACT|nr:glycosyltransferase [Alkalibacterium pelagium]GEN50741.1 glycosyl transferase family 2 [Alkalibacterium pelagium]SEK86310.1 poly-beta-1,6 N-acetyl-D-glucosamine synthase [Alkalibacterium pelagium]
MRMTQEENIRFVFLENSGKRWKYSKRVLGIMMLLILAFLFFIIMGLISKPILQSLEMSNGNIVPINNPVSTAVVSAEDDVSFDSLAVTGQEQQPTVFTFFQSSHFSNAEHHISLDENMGNTDVLVPDWFYLNERGEIDVQSNSRIDSLGKDHDVLITPSITLGEGVDAEGFHNLLASPDSQDQMVAHLLETTEMNEYQGIHLHFDDVLWEDKELFNAFITKTYQAFHEADLSLSLFIRLGDDTYDSSLLSKVSDYIMVNLFDQHIEQGESGPLASFKWTQEMLSTYEGSMDKLVPVLANYAYDWNVSTGEAATTYDFSSLMEKVNRENLKINWDDHSSTPYLRYKNEQDEHIVWMLDGVTFYNQLKLVQGQNVPSIGIWNVGSEDPSIWNVLSGRTTDPAGLKTIPNRVSVAQAGEGDFLKVTQEETEGERRIELDNHFIKQAEYERYPSPYLLEKYGVEDKRVAISFDDGPDPRYTRKVLDILNEYNVKAGFFVIGQNAAMHPRLTKAIFDEGHELGSHTFSHRDITSLSDTELAFELNATQRVIQGITGHSAVMFRPPYLAINDLPGQLPTESMLRRFLNIQDLGYTIVSASIDPRDWSGKTADQIVNDTVSRVENGRTILLHDSGGDRTPTLEALPRIIEWLQANDYTIVPVSELIGLEREGVMPRVQENEKSILSLFLYGSLFNAVLNRTIRIFLSVLITMGLVRMVILIYFSFRQKIKSEQLVFEESDLPFVTVLIAAYNEEEVIDKTMQSILNSSYPHFEIIIVDDGSTDQTASIVERAAERHPKIQLIRKPNGGKASALNLGIEQATADYIVTLDADTVIAEDTIALIIRPFCDPNVGAVSGNVKIGNCKNILTWWQHIEYVTGYNLEKRALDELDSITVVPGAIGAWRKSALEAVGLFEEDTLAEDTDVTMKLLRRGYKIRSEVKAIAYTEAPEDLKSFIKQRYRWTFGILQCLRKHQKALFNLKNKKLGFISIPNMIFQYILLASAPLVDYIFILALFSGNMTVVYFYIIFLLADSLVSVYAFGLERENKKPLLSLFIQRLVYRQFFTFVVWKSLLNAVKGQLQGWNKLKRTGNVGRTQTFESQERENYHTTVH